MTTLDITADLNDEDDTGFVWTFLDEAGYEPPPTLHGQSRLRPQT